MSEGLYLLLRHGGEAQGGVSLVEQGSVTLQVVAQYPSVSGQDGVDVVVLRPATDAAKDILTKLRGGLETRSSLVFEDLGLATNEAHKVLRSINIRESRLRKEEEIERRS